MPEYIARISYGKDSLKMLEVIKSRGLPLDRITTTDVWATDTISANLPPMDAFKAKMDQWIWDKYRIEVEHLCSLNSDGTKRTYEQMFYHVPVRRSKIVNVESRGQSSDSRCMGSRGVRRSNGIPKLRISVDAIKGFPQQQGPWCQSVLKRNRLGSPSRVPGTDIPVVPKAQDPQSPQPHFFDSPPRRADTNTVEYLGIAADEPHRFGQLCEKKQAPLVMFDIDEGLCGLYCQYNDILAPTYESSCRDGCWFCHNQGVNSLRLLRRNYPDLWTLLMKWDLDSPSTYHADGHTVHDFDFRFQLEDEGKVPTDRRFRWKMLEV